MFRFSHKSSGRTWTSSFSSEIDIRRQNLGKARPGVFDNFVFPVPSPKLHNRHLKTTTRSLSLPLSCTGSTHISFRVSLFPLSCSFSSIHIYLVSCISFFTHCIFPFPGEGTSSTVTHPELSEHLVGRSREGELPPRSDDADSPRITRVSQDLNIIHTYGVHTKHTNNNKIRWRERSTLRLVCSAK